MIKTKELIANNMKLDELINNFISSNITEDKLIDIKYNPTNNSVLVVYSDGYDDRSVLL